MNLLEVFWSTFTENWRCWEVLNVKNWLLMDENEIIMSFVSKRWEIGLCPKIKTVHGSIYSSLSDWWQGALQPGWRSLSWNNLFNTSKLYYGFPIFILGYQDKNSGHNITTVQFLCQPGEGGWSSGLVVRKNAAEQVHCNSSLWYPWWKLHVWDGAGWLLYGKLKHLGWTEISERTQAPILESCRSFWIIGKISYQGKMASVIY